MSEKLGIIGGSGLYDIPEITKHQKIKVSTPFGEPSDEYCVGRMGDKDVVFLARHGRAHRLMPSEINYRANIYGMKEMGVTQILAASAVGSLREDYKPLDFVVPDQLVDRTQHRQQTFFGNGIVAHISFADPFCPHLRKKIVEICHHLGIKVHDGGTYVNMEGPAFSTRAESHLYRSWGMDIIGMTNLVEAKLSREAEICYATMAMVTDFDCWHEEEEAVTVEALIATLQQNSQNARQVVASLIQDMPNGCDAGCRNALAYAIITDRSAIPEEAKQKLGVLIKKYFE
ncbi:MAG: S-methyl-5'-thioadenosine phosphorylase [Chlamydiota bacterium]|nr:S-methyl-5'-thioadenosine phosphorylase [Chlamydiota bacterium]